MDDIPLRPDGLQLDEDRKFQRRFWKAERVAWGIFVIVLAAALAGLTGGGGPLADGIRQFGGVRVEYPVIARWTTPDSMTIGLSEPGRHRVVLGPEFLAAFEIETIRPEPVASSTTPDGLRLELDVDGRGAAPVFLGIQALTAGRVRYDVTVEGAGTATFTTFILP